MSDSATPSISLWRGPDATETVSCHPRDIAGILKQNEGALWVHIDSRSRPQHAMLEHLFHFHPLAVEDTLNPSTRVKLEEYEGYLFVVVHAITFCESTEDPYDLETTPLYAFLSGNSLVTVSPVPISAVTTMAERITRNPELMSRGLDRLLHGLLDEIVDSYFPILTRIDEFVDGLEERVFVAFDETALRDIFQVKRLVLSLRRQLSPQREVLATLTNRPTPLLQPAAQLYYRDIYDHVLRINESLDTYRDLLSSTMDSYLTQVSNRLGATTKALSVLATMSLPFVVVSGMWGMNFSKVPFSNRPEGFWIMLFLQLAMGGLLLLFLRRRRFL